MSFLGGLPDFGALKEIKALLADTARKIRGSKLEPAFYAKTPSEIKYAERPGAEYKVIPTQQFAAQRGINFMESMMVPPDIRDGIWTDKQFPKLAASKIEERLHNPLDFMIVKVNDTVGEGLALPPDSKPIKEGTVLFVYAAKIEDSLVPSAEHSYTMGLSEVENEPSVLSELMLRPRANADHQRGFASFVLDAPTHLEIAKSKLDPEALRNVLDENCTHYATVYKGCPVSVYIAMRDIYPGELLTSAYEGQFWRTGKRCVLNKKMEIIGHFNEEGDIEIKSSYKPTPEMNAPRFNFEQIAAKFKELIKSPASDNDNFYYRQRFSADVNLALEVFSGRFAKESLAGQFVANVREAVKETLHKNTDKAYKTLLSFFQGGDLYEKVSDSLAALKTELIFHMEKYNATKKLQKLAIMQAQSPDTTGAAAAAAGAKLII